MSGDRSPHLSARRRLFAGGAIALASAAILTTTSPASAAAIFFPRGSGARVDRHHVTVSISATGTIAWDAVDLGGSGTADVGVIVAVKMGGRVEVTARVWVDVVEEATRVRVSTVPALQCKAIGGQGSASASGQVGAGIGGSGTGESSSGCSGNESSGSDGGGGCYSNASTPGGGCGGCDSCEPSEHGHPGCSAFMTTGPGCGPLDPSERSSSGGPTTRPDASVDAPRIGPYELFKVGAADGSAARWLDANGYDPGASFDVAAAALERDGYDLVALRARAPAAPAIVQSLRVVTTSSTPALPLRLLRMGSNLPELTPLTLVVLASTPQRLVDTTAMRVDPARLAYKGLGGGPGSSASNYEELVAALLGEAPARDAGDGSTGLDPDAAPEAIDGGATRWLFESARSVENRVSLQGASRSEAGASEAPTLADEFRTQCGEKTSVKHAVCGAEEDGGEEDAGVADAATDGDTDAAPSDADAGADAASDAASGCPELGRQRCDDLDLAIPPNSTLVATRFRGRIGGDPASIADLVFAASTDALLDGRYTVRDDGQPGLCENTTASDSAKRSEDDAQTCRQPAARTRAWTRLDLGPLVTLLVAIRAVVAIMRRARERRTK